MFHIRELLIILLVAATAAETSDSANFHKPTEPNHHRTTESWEEFWNDDDETNETQFPNPETSTQDTIPESTTSPTQRWTTESWDDFWNDESNDYDILFYDYIKKVKWMRAKDIVERNGYKRPLVFKEGHTRFDINQGYLGNCWFLAALALLPAYPKVFDKVMDRNQTFDNNPAGIFHFKFWQYGEWVDVVIDDYFPTTHDGQLMFLKSDSPDEFWTALIEKAYAKLYGNYVSALSGGLIGSAMEDLSGGVTESYHRNFFNSVTRNGRSWPASFKVLLRAYQKGSMIAAAILFKGKRDEEEEQVHSFKSNRIDDLKKQKYEDIKKQLEQKKNPIFEDEMFPKSISSIGPIKEYFSSRRNEENQKFENGLVDGHAYSITKVVQFESNGTVHQLLRVRNPWGNSLEWTGPWSDFSSEWNNLSDEYKTDLGLQKEDDGEFFMSYKDFVQHFDWLDICHVSMHSFDESNIGWYKQEIHGSWTNGAKPNENPQYLVELKDTDSDSDDTCTCLISLLQIGGRRRRAEGRTFRQAFPPIRFALIDATNAQFPMSKDAIEKALFKAKKTQWMSLRANTMRFEVPPGKYIILPMTTSNQDLKFMLRVFSEMPVNLISMDQRTTTESWEEFWEDSDF